MPSHYPFAPEPLPYDYEALEPYLNAETLRFHHDKHYQTYCDNLNRALESHPDYHQRTLEELLTGIDALPETARTAVRNNAGGVYSHALYFDSMTPCAAEPGGELAAAIERSFGSFDECKRQLREAALGQFGSGWAWLCAEGRGCGCEGGHGRLRVVKTPNQDTPLASGLRPLFLVDVWEHAYYLQYQNRRPEYLDSWFHLIDWEQAGRRYSGG